MTEHDDETRILDHWSHRLSHALHILDLQADHAPILELAAESARSVSPSAGAISTFYVGYAAALAATSGHIDAQSAVRSAVEKAMKLCEDGKEPGPGRGGWTETAQ
jgi:hypothetical protein